MVFTPKGFSSRDRYMAVVSPSVSGLVAIMTSSIPPADTRSTILRADSYEAAEGLCRREPLVAEGFAAYKLKAMQPANRDNNYLL